MKYFVPAILVVTLLKIYTSTIISPCDVAQGFLDGGASKNDLNDWVCIAKGESSFNISAINEFNSDGSWDYGIIQVNSKYWCKGQKTQSNGCNITCSDLVTGDSIEPSVKCALKIKKEQGFSAWVAWNKKCKGKNLSHFTKHCKLNDTVTEEINQKI